MEQDQEAVLKKATELLVRCATADSVVRANNPELTSMYFDAQNHKTLKHLIETHIRTAAMSTAGEAHHLLQITTHSKQPITRPSVDLIAAHLQIPNENIDSLLLHSFETQQQFSGRVKQFLMDGARASPHSPRLMMIQCDFSKKFDADLLSCVRYSIVELLKEAGKWRLNQKKNFYLVK